MATHKKHDLERGHDSNPDPITGEPGAHPVGVGAGAAAGGAAGMAVGTMGGPVGMAVGAAAGAVVGGLLGKGAAESIDPTEGDTYLRDKFCECSYAQKGETFDTYRPAYQYGGAAESRFQGRKFADVEPELRTDWEATHASKVGMAWDRARHAVRDAFDRTIQLREERLKATKTPVEAGEVKVRKEVHRETKTIEVPVEREEVVIERHRASGKAAAGDIGEETIRVPVKEEHVTVTKEPVVVEEVSVGKRKVQDTKHVSDTVRKETLKVDNAGGAKVVDETGESRKR